MTPPSKRDAQPRSLQGFDVDPATRAATRHSPVDHDGGDGQDAQLVRPCPDLGRVHVQNFNLARRARGAFDRFHDLPARRAPGTEYLDSSFDHVASSTANRTMLHRGGGYRVKFKLTHYRKN